jgi:hypothetical protein
MSILTVVICFILFIGISIAQIDIENKDTDYLRSPLLFTMLLLVASFWVFDDKFESKKLELGLKDIYFIWVVFSPVLIALLVSIASPKKNIIKFSELDKISLNDRSMSSLDEAKKAEFKGEWQKAIGLYQDTLYYLKNDYKKLSKKGEKEKQAHVYMCEERIRVLGNHK